MPTRKKITRKKKSAVVAKVATRDKSIFIATVIAVIVLIFGASITGKNLLSSITETNESQEYQAIHLNTGRIFFGKVSENNENFITIEDVFYFLDESEKKLVKRNQDSLSIKKSHVANTEILNNENAVLKAIHNYKNKN
jgi:hypothetical protein